MSYRGRPAATTTLIDITREKSLESQLMQSPEDGGRGYACRGRSPRFQQYPYHPYGLTGRSFR